MIISCLTRVDAIIQGGLNLKSLLGIVQKWKENSHPSSIKKIVKISLKNPENIKIKIK